MPELPSAVRTPSRPAGDAREKTMSIILIQPVVTTTSAGFNAIISGIAPSDHDCLVGSITTPGRGLIDVRWNLGGTCRDIDDSCNLDMRKYESSDVHDTPERLGATS